MRHYWLMYQIALSRIFLKPVWYPNSLKKNGPPQCRIYTLGQLSKLYVLIRLEETNKKESREDITFSHWFHSVIRFSNQEAFPFLYAFIIPLAVMVNYGDIQFPERIMVARRSEMSAEWKVRFAIKYQGRIQDFKLGGAHFKKLRRAEGGAKIVGVFRV